MATNLSVAALDEAVDTLLNNNFDADTKVCFVTLMKVLDNVISKPMDPKVRSIRLGNPAFSKKVSSRTGGIDFLLACGFVQEAPAPGLLSTRNDPQEAFLVLKDEEDDNGGESLPPVQATAARHERKEAYKSHIITARRLLLTRAIRDLHMKAEELPAYKPPPPPVAMTFNFTSSNDAASATFNPFQTQRYDGMSAAVGAQLTPDGSYESSTDKKLKTLQQQKEKLEQKLQNQSLAGDRQWVATSPNESGQPTAAMRDAMQVDDNSKGSASLVAAQFQKQQAARKQREEGGFTTKSMRDLERIKKSKVYSHTQLALQFTDGTVLRGKFLPKESIETVVTALKECFFEVPSSVIELYVTPPRRTLPPASTLQAEGLVPAAKVFVRVSLPDRRPFLKPELFAAASSQAAAFPTSQPVVADKSNNTANDGDSKAAAAAAKPPMSAEDKEAALMQRMMGGGRRLGGGGGGGNPASGTGAKKPKGGTGKPKWFK